MQTIARIPLPGRAFEHAHLGEARAVAFLGSSGWTAWSLVDGRLLWSRPRHELVRFLGADARVGVVQETRRPDGRPRWLEGIDLATGACLFRHESTPEAIARSVVIDDHAYALAAKGSLRIELGTGRVEATSARPWYPGPGGHYGLDGAHLTRFDGRGVQRVAKVPKLALLGIAGRHAVLTRAQPSTDRVTLLDLETTAAIELELPRPATAVVRKSSLVLAPVDGSAVAIDVEALARSRAEGGAVPLAQVPIAWRLEGVRGVQRELDGEALLAVGVGLVHARDGRVLVPDGRIDRACGTEAHLVAWSTARGDLEATFYRA